LIYFLKSPIIIFSDLRLYKRSKKEEAWHINKVVAADSVAVPGRCTRRFAENVKKNAKCLLNPEKIVRYIAKIVIPNVKTKAVKIKDSKKRGTLLFVTS
jgi:hypothetical protein